MASKLPTPRMQLRWEASTEPGHQWQCHYELVILLDKWDVRREVYKAGQIIEHPEYGRGKVENARRDTIMVRFSTGLKSLLIS